MIFSKKIVKELIKKYDINLDVVPIDEIYDGMSTEYEHSGIMGHGTNVTSGGDPLKTFKIVLAHLLENPRYYRYLKEMESKADKYWSTREKPSIFNKK